MPEIMTTSEKYLNNLINKLAPHQEKLKSHRLYKLLNSVDSIRIFMEFHVFAVWDFMSTVKALQNNVACQSIPWMPKPNPSLTRLVNSIILDEESDLDINNEPKSHFAMYLEAMEEMGVKTTTIDKFISTVRARNSVAEGLKPLNKGIQDFITETFKIINSNKVHQIASAFTFGRENMIPTMFIQILNQEGWKDEKRKFIYYLDRHVEVDGDEHGPAALKMVQIMCGDDPKKWQEAEEATLQALKARDKFWSAIANEIDSRMKMSVNMRIPEQYLNNLINKLAPYQDKLKSHRLYKLLNSVESIKIFMEFHVFAVWDFMSTVKALQNNVACQSIPWMPKPNPSLTRLVNSIILDEESDLDINNEPKSHFAMYLEAMEEMGVKTTTIEKFISTVRIQNSVAAGLKPLNRGIQEFMTETFKIINSNKVHQIASAFTFGRENMIPTMFIQILSQEGWKDEKRKFIYYLDRHVEVDGDEHGPAALEMVKIMCGEDPKAWKEAEDATIQALKARDKFWSAIATEIETRMRL